MKLIGDITNVEFEGIDYSDSPDFCDAYIISADLDGVPMTEEQMNHRSEKEIDLVKQMATHILNTNTLNVEEQTTQTINVLNEMMGIYA